MVVGNFRIIRIFYAVRIIVLRFSNESADRFILLLLLFTAFSITQISQFAHFE